MKRIRRRPKPPQLKVKSSARAEVQDQKKRKKEYEDGLVTEWLVHRCLIADKNKVCTLANLRGVPIPNVLHEMIEEYFKTDNVKKEVSSLLSSM